MKDISNALPRVISDHIAAHNKPDPEAFLTTFAPDALVNDAKREFLGAAAIRAWADKEIFGDRVKLDLQDAFDNRGDIVLRARITGDFDKANLPDPVILTYYFSLRDGLITQLIIILNASVA
ncbi:MAG: nuclear transport factor 2 family protein [Rhizomicrobium sp.]